MIEKFCAFSLLVVSIYYILLHESLILLIAVTVIGSLYICLKPVFVSLFEESVLSNKSIEVPSHAKHDERRFNTYPCPVFNTWYHFCDSDELKDGKVIEFRALGRVFVLWRNDEGQPVCQDAFCIHLGANLGKGGKVVDNCLECPFHKWKFASDGTVKEVPYLKNPSMCQTGKKLKTYHCQDWCGLVMVYFHADDKEPEYQLPAFVECDMKRDGWTPHTKWNIGYVRFTAIDFADQAGDHSHFQTLHSDFMIPWTRVPLPKWFLRLCPVGISHTCTTYRGDDKEWADYVANSDWGTVDRYLLFFTDLAGLTWQGETMKPTLAATREMYVGPCLINFHIPFTIGMEKYRLSDKYECLPTI